MNARKNDPSFHFFQYHQRSTINPHFYQRPEDDTMMHGYKQVDDRDDKDTLPFMTEEDTQECASFLLTLKHRSVTPDPFEMVELSPRLEAFHGGHPGPVIEPLYLSGGPDDSDDSVSHDKAPPLFEEPDDEVVSVESLIREGGMLVSLNDRDLVPDSLFVAMAQMKPCQLTEPDRVGCYKNREIGFTGMCCRHCGGSPGFGKYFPATVRSLAQTTTSQTILKHVGSKCRFCPPHIRKTILELQRQQAAKEAKKQTGRPRYGSRKVFFQRIWGRLHNEDIPERPLHRQLDSCDESSTAISHLDSDLESEGESVDSFAQHRRKHRFGALPTKKNLKRKRDTSLERAAKRSRDIHLVY